MPQRASIPSVEIDLVSRVAVLERTVLALCEQVQRLTARPVDDVTFLAAIAAAVGELEFSPRELENHAIADPALTAALAGASPKQIGRRLGRLAGEWVGCYRVTCSEDRYADGYHWRVQERLIQPNE